MNDIARDSAAGKVLAHYSRAAPPIQLESLHGAGGFSGAEIWRVTTAETAASAPSAAGSFAITAAMPVAGQGRYCLRRWPKEADLAQLQWIHAVLRHVGGDPANSPIGWRRPRVLPPLGFVPVPLVADRAAGAPTLVEHAGHFWELTPWMPGEADYAARPSPARLAAALQALAGFHLAAASITRPTSAPAPAILERAARLAELQQQQHARIAAAVHRQPDSPLVACGQRVLEQFHLLAPPLAVALGIAARVGVPLQVAIRDVWHDHVLFTGDVVTGLVDYGAMRIDSPLADVARLVGSLAGDDGAARACALAAYDAVRPLGAQDRRLIDILDYSGQLIAGLNWLEWLYLDRREFDNPAAILARLQQILARLQHIECAREG